MLSKETRKQIRLRHYLHIKESLVNYVRKSFVGFVIGLALMTIFTYSMISAFEKQMDVRETRYVKQGHQSEP